MKRVIDLLHNDAARLAKELSDTIMAEKNIDSLLMYTKARCEIIQETLEAIKKLKQ